MPGLGYTEIAPDTSLRRYVECFWSSEAGRDVTGHRVLPDGCADILFSTGNDTQPGLTVVGLMTTPQVLDVKAGQRYFGVRFRPGMAHAFVPECTLLTDRIEPLENLWGARARSLMNELLECANPLQISRVMQRRLALWQPDTGDGDVLGRVFLPGAPPVAISDRHLRRLCLARTGVSPKYLRRILRFRSVVARVRNVRLPVNWAHVAAASGYYDQAHMIREFQEFAGMTPGRFLQSHLSGAA